jgi:hypothetical protein
MINNQIQSLNKKFHSKDISSLNDQTSYLQVKYNSEHEHLKRVSNTFQKTIKSISIECP